MENSSLKYGIAAGLLTIIFYTVVYMIDRSLFFSPIVHWSSFLFYIYFMAVAWKDAGKPEDFRESLKIMFVIYLIANAIYYIFYYLIFKVVDPDIVEIQKEMMVSRGMDIEGINFDLNFTQLILGYASSCIGGFVIAAITAYLVKKL